MTVGVAARCWAGLVRWWHRGVADRAAAKVGGLVRLQVIVLLACVLGLQSADNATVGAIAAPLSKDLGIGNTQIGLLVTLTTGIGALATLPVGMLVDRVHRVRLLTGAIVVWSVAMAVSGFATSFVMLLLTRLALGAVIATASPVIASLIGDFFSATERGRIYGYILLGELLGAGLGLIVSGSVAGAISWRASFIVLAVPGLVLAWAVHRLLPEPTRGGQSLAVVGDDGQEQDADNPDEDTGVVEEVEKADDVAPRSALADAPDPASMSMLQAVRYILAVPTNRVLIAASALAYFFFTGLQTFAVEFLRGRFGVGQAVASILVVLIGVGAVFGVLLGGRIADRLIGRGVIAGRPLVAGVALLLTVVVAAPSLLVGSLLLAVALLFVAAAAFGATNPPLDAARLDVMHHRLWGRAESVRTLLRSVFTAIAPLVFGYVSTLFGGTSGGFGGSGGTQNTAAQPGGGGLGPTFLIMLAPVVLAGLLLLLRGARSYPRDVATAMAAEDRTSQESGDANV